MRMKGRKRGQITCKKERRWKEERKKNRQDRKEERKNNFPQ